MKLGTKIHGVPVIAPIHDIGRVAKECSIESVIIAIPSLNHKRVRQIYDSIKAIGIKDVKIAPSVSHLPSEVIRVKDLRDISIEDLLSREVVSVEEELLREFIQEKVVLVSGAGGSIGSELVRQLVRFAPKRVVALDIDETELHNLQLELKNSAENTWSDVEPVVADVRDREKLLRIFREAKPHIVFHAAAYKHVPLMEFFPEEAIRTNVLGTYNMAVCSLECGVEKFVNVSTDKAVNPSNVMGATKRIAEILCKALNSEGKTKFISVRFGNVMGSRGSVVPIFLQQIRKGGPITITHPDMERYFMTIPEAVLLIIQAAAIGKGGEIFVLDMGQPVKILKLAEELIRLQGLEPYRDIDIVFTGLRPGEKISESLVSERERIDRTSNRKIYVIREERTYSAEEIKGIVENLLELIGEESDSIREKLFRILRDLEDKGYPTKAST
jgi:FlaA1/EpsC-like NDP-sugar epimerase